MNKKTLSIACATYNHEKFIAQTLDGFLMQKTDFDFEIVVGEDCSTDNTRRILLEYDRKHPGKFKLLLNEKNLGMSANGIHTVQACEGKYIALCEGDDYWTDPQKLQKQVDFLETNPDFVTCHHRAEILDEKTNTFSLTNAQKEITGTDDLFKGCFITTCTCVFRNGHLDNLYPLVTKDWALHLLLSMHGKIYFMSDVMSVYRRHAGGWTFGSTVANLKSDIETIKNCRAHLYPALQEGFDSYLAFIYSELCFFYFQNKDFEDFNKSYLEYSDYWKFLGQKTQRALKLRKILSSFPYLANKFISFRTNES